MSGTIIDYGVTYVPATDQGVCPEGHACHLAGNGESRFCFHYPDNGQQWWPPLMDAVIRVTLPTWEAVADELGDIARQNRGGDIAGWGEIEQFAVEVGWLEVAEPAGEPAT